jgi:hypothetical protein
VAKGDATFKFDTVVSVAEFNVVFGSLGKPDKITGLSEAVASLREQRMRRMRRMVDKFAVEQMVQQMDRDELREHLTKELPPALACAEHAFEEP